jgi:hypothetical protein
VQELSNYFNSGLSLSSADTLNALGNLAQYVHGALNRIEQASAVANANCAQIGSGTGSPGGRGRGNPCASPIFYETAWVEYTGPNGSRVVTLNGVSIDLDMLYRGRSRTAAGCPQKHYRTEDLTALLQTLKQAGVQQTPQGPAINIPAKKSDLYDAVLNVLLANGAIQLRPGGPLQAPSNTQRTGQGRAGFTGPASPGF